MAAAPVASDNALDDAFDALDALDAAIDSLAAGDTDKE